MRPPAATVATSPSATVPATCALTAVRQRGAASKINISNLKAIVETWWLLNFRKDVYLLIPTKDLCGN